MKADTIKQGTTFLCIIHAHEAADDVQILHALCDIPLKSIPSSDELYDRGLTEADWLRKEGWAEMVDMPTLMIYPHSKIYWPE